MANIYEKVQLIKTEILKAGLKKTGLNKFSNFSYFELADFLPKIIELCEKNKVCTYVSFDNEKSTLVVVNSEKSEERIEISSPMRNLELKGCNEIQALGGVETYSRRYLYMALFDITENDMFDSIAGTEKNEKQKEIEKPEKMTSEQEVWLKENGADLNKTLAYDKKVYKTDYITKKSADKVIDELKKKQGLK